MDVLSSSYRQLFRGDRLRLLNTLSVCNLSFLERCSITLSWDDRMNNSDSFSKVEQLQLSFEHRLISFVAVQTDHESLDFFEGNLNTSYFESFFGCTLSSKEGQAIESFLRKVISSFESLAPFLHDPALSCEYHDLISFYGEAF